MPRVGRKHGLCGEGAAGKESLGTRRGKLFSLSSLSDGKCRTARNEAGELGRVQTIEVLMPNMALDTLTLKTNKQTNK